MSAGQTEILAAASTPIASPALDVFAYPHILSLILNNTSTPTLATLLRCSREMLKSVSPRLYGRLHLTPLQLKRMLETGWTVKGSSAFSASLFLCLQQTRTLHLESYKHDITYPKIPRGLFTGCTRVVLHVNDPITATTIYTFAPLFQSLGSHLYIKLADDVVLQDDFDQEQAVARLSALPRSFTAVTFLVPHAYCFPSAPSCGYGGTPAAHDPSITVVLVPWAIDPRTDIAQKTVGERWSMNAGLGALSMGLERIGQYIGLENTGTVLGRRMFNFPQSGPNGEEAPGPICAGFAEWLAALEDRTVFTDVERDVLMMTHCELFQEVAHSLGRELAREIELGTARGVASESIARSKTFLEEWRVADTERCIALARMKERLSKGESLRPYF